MESGTATLPSRIVPKGLRSFDAQDADFFLELLPGPRDREGLPESRPVLEITHRRDGRRCDVSGGRHVRTVRLWQVVAA